MKDEDWDTDVELLQQIEYGYKQEIWEELEIFKHTLIGREQLVNVISTQSTPFFSGFSEISITGHLMKD